MFSPRPAARASKSSTGMPASTSAAVRAWPSSSSAAFPGRATPSSRSSSSSIPIPARSSPPPRPAAPARTASSTPTSTSSAAASPRAWASPARSSTRRAWPSPRSRRARPRPTPSISRAGNSSNVIDEPGARKSFEKAVALDPEFALAYVRLAQTLERDGDMAKIQAAYRKAKELSARAPEKERVLIEARYAWRVEDDNRKAIELLRTLVAKYPTEKEFHFELGAACTPIPTPRSPSIRPRWRSTPSTATP